MNDHLRLQITQVYGRYINFGLVHNYYVYWPSFYHRIIYGKIIKHSIDVVGRVRWLFIYSYMIPIKVLNPCIYFLSLNLSLSLFHSWLLQVVISQSSGCVLLHFWPKNELSAWIWFTLDRFYLAIFKANFSTLTDERYTMSREFRVTIYDLSSNICFYHV